MSSVRESGSHRTPAELVREKRLRDDPMAEVHGPLFVTCRRCGRRIKLSPKSAYDPFHWTKHRERCLNKSLGKARATSAVRRTPKSPYPPPLRKKSPSSSTTDGDNATPPLLTPEDDRTKSSDIFERRHSSPPLRKRNWVPDVDSPVAEHLDRSQSSLKPFPPTEPWQSWDWSELRYPTWLTSLMIVDGDQDGSDGDHDLDGSPIELVPEHALTRYSAVRNLGNPSLPT